VSGSGTALIGHTGFVGGTLARAEPFDFGFNSRNIGEIAGRSYDKVVCAGAPAVKWLANKDPEADRASIAKLTDALERVETREFVLISTIDVYPDPASRGDEDEAIDPDANHAYGANRYRLECWARDRFPKVRIVRLPALFGTGLKKNALYDLLHGNATQSINPLGVFQWYPMERLASDLRRIETLDLALVNLFPEPSAMSALVDRFFPHAQVGPPTRPAPRYNLRTKYASRLGGEAGYIMSADQVLGSIAEFVTTETSRLSNVA
jgi:hypothetical protein